MIRRMGLRAYEPYTDRVTPYGRLHSGPAEKMTFHFRTGPEQISFTDSWLKDSYVSEMVQAVEAQGGKVYRVTLIRDTSPTWWTDWRGEVVADVRGELSGYHQMPFPWMAVLGVAFVALLAYFLIRPTIESVTELIWGPGGGSPPWPIIVVGLVILSGTFTRSRRSNE